VPAAGAAAGTPSDPGRTELVREELDVNGVSIDGTLEVVSEFAVDLAFGASVAQVLVSPGPPPTTTQSITWVPSGASDLYTLWAGNNAVTSSPQRIRAVRARLGVRSVEADRLSGLSGGSDAGGLPIGPGLYRFGVGPNAFARVRTMQSDVALRNQVGVLWP
jgi:hypothetical protein